ncbi:MAG TPA: hypothetical protein PLO51_01315 [Candidatus Micrarchaeota archaeon]|nr:hypothetical protein [Candidatus Micrarchaeota archaeon]
MNEPLDTLEKQWKNACRLVLGAEVGSLATYEKWLSEWSEGLYYSKSSISGKQVAFGMPDYPSGSKRMSFEEVDFGRKFAPLEIDEIKDIDSIFQAVSDRAFYTGNIVLGNSKYVEKSTNVSDSFYVYGSSRAGDSKYLAYSSMARECECVFGTAAPGESKYLIRCSDTYRAQRCLEGWMVATTTDSYYVFDLNYCSNCMFSFNLRNAKYCIGNAQLDRSKYLSVKASLLVQLRGELESKRRLPSLLELIGPKKPDYAPAKAALSGMAQPRTQQGDMAPIESAFSKTSKLLLGEELEGLSGYSAWLSRHLALGKQVKSVISKTDIFQGAYARYFEVPESRIVREDEALALAAKLKPAFDPETVSLENAGDLMRGIAYMSLEIRDGANKNIINCMAYANSSNCYFCVPCVHTKDSAYNFWLRSTESVFGSSVVFDSSFCIHCYQSAKLSRCFECDACRECTGLYFCHNCENVHDSMFCFNAKNLKYAIGNREYPREEYMAVKKKVLGEIAGKLAREKAFPLGIYNMGAGKRA